MYMYIQIVSESHLVHCDASKGGGVRTNIKACNFKYLNIDMHQIHIVADKHIMNPNAAPYFFLFFFGL